MKKLFVFFVGAMMTSSSYGMMVEAQRVMQTGIVDIYYPLEMSLPKIIVRTHAISSEKFRENADDLYLSIDDFLNDNRRTEMEERCSVFIKQCEFLVPNDIRYKQIFDEEIVPDFEKFATETAPCEVDGFYEKEKVSLYCKFLRARLEILRKSVVRE